MTEGSDHNTAPQAPLPSGWAWATLPDLARLNPPLDIRIEDEDRPITFVPMAAVDEGFGGVQRPGTRTYGQVKKGYTPFQTGDVIMAKITPCMENGKGGFVKGEPGEVFFGSTEFHVLRPYAEVAPEWISHYLSRQQLRRAARLKMKGSAGQLRVPEQFLAALEIPIAPLAEQARIVDRIDELFTDLAAGVAALERVKRNLSRYRAAVLHAAVTGRLTEAWRKEHGPPEEPAPKLLERILVERRKQWERRTLAAYEAKGKQPPKNWKSRYKEPAPPKLPEDGTSLPELPKGWCWASNDQLVGIITSGSRDWSPYYGSGTGTFIMAQNVRMGRLDRTYRQAVDPPPDHRDRKRSQVEEHDLLVTIVGANTGDVCRVPEPLPEHYVCQSVALMRPVLGAFSHWLEVWFTAPTGAQRQFKEFIYGAGRPHLGFEHLEQTLVALPPLEEQTAVIELATEQLSQIDALEAEVTRGLARAGRLRQAILKAAFEGKLVHQDPSDEPASVLLERICEQAANAPKPKRTTKKRSNRKAATR